MGEIVPRLCLLMPSPGPPHCPKIGMESNSRPRQVTCREAVGTQSGEKKSSTSTESCACSPYICLFLFILLGIWHMLFT
jgi:hypothetical protein